jgi:hypothetical protein
LWKSCHIAETALVFVTGFTTDSYLGIYFFVSTTTAFTARWRAAFSEITGKKCLKNKLLTEPFTLILHTAFGVRL